jgi:1-acyl-sn-glycerol-3-phosphate acyltransferase
MSATSDAFLAEHPELLSEDLTSPAAYRRASWFMAPWAAYFRFRLEGWEHLPPGPCIVAANHSLLSPFVLPLLARAWHQHQGDRPVRGMMHRVAYQFPFRQLGALQALGGLYAHPEVGRAALARGCALLVFPGGEHDAFRPFSERYRAHFAGRTGFARLAREAGVPVVPLAICGSQAGYFALPGSETVGRWLRVQRWTGLKRFPLTVGIVGLAAMAVTPGLQLALGPAAALAAMPLPTRIEARFLPTTTRLDSDTDGVFAERVRQELEGGLQAMSRSRRTFLG